MDLTESRTFGFVRNIPREDGSFYIALCVSLIIHASIIGYFSSQNINILNRQVKQIEVTYQVIEEVASEKPRLEKKMVRVVREEPLPKKVEILSKDSNELPFFAKAFKDISKLSDHFRFSQKQNPTIRTLDVSRGISVPMLKSEKISNPRYLSYNQNIRQLIKQQAYRFIENPEFRAGEVYLTFVLGASGALQDLQVIERLSHASEFLKLAGLRSIKDANPFPPFPTDLNYPELTFNVVISFEVNE